MSPDKASEKLQAALAVTREDVARAKSYLLGAAGGRTDELADEWLARQDLVIPRQVETDSPTCEEALVNVARAYSVRLALYQAVCELVAAGELIAADQPTRWTPSLAYRTPHGSGGINTKMIGCSFPGRVERPPLAPDPTTDPDIFLQGIDCKSLHAGIKEAINQALACFRRGLYMPATAMLAAAAEATWTECGMAVATRLGDAKLQGVVGDPYASISKKAVETRKSLETANGKLLLKAAGQSSARITDAEVWTTVLRDRRNALHWTKAKSFVAEHSDTASLLLGAPLHLGSLEAVRLAC